MLQRPFDRFPGPVQRWAGQSNGHGSAGAQVVTPGFSEQRTRLDVTVSRIPDGESSPNGRAGCPSAHVHPEISVSIGGVAEDAVCSR